MGLDLMNTVGNYDTSTGAFAATTTMPYGYAWPLAIIIFFLVVLTLFKVFERL